MRSLPCRFPRPKLYTLLSPSRASYKPCLINTPSFVHPNNITWNVEHMKRLVIQLY
jgi:hypothetical protein